MRSPLDKMTHQQSTDKPLISDEVVVKWQRIVDLIARVVGVPASRITRFESPEIEVFITSNTKGNPYHNGKRLNLDSGSYCESVISQSVPLLVPSTINTPKWDHNPDIKLGLVSYFGLPLQWPNGNIFGTLCVLDNKENHYSDEYRDLLSEFKDVIESDLATLSSSDETSARLDSVPTKEGEQRFRLLADHVPAFFSYIGPEMKYHYVNKQYEKVFGIPQEEIVGKHIKEILGEQSFNSIKHYLESALSGKEVAYETELPTTHAGTRWMATRLVPDVTSDKKVNGIYVLVNDFTERKQAEQALEKSEQKYRELVDEAATIILRWDIKGNVTFFNEYAQKFFGFTEKEIVGNNVVGTIVPETEFTGRDLALLMDEICNDPAKFEDNENENIKRNGERVWIAWKNRPIYNERGELFEIHSVGIEITARKRVEDALRQSEARWRSITENSPDHIIMVDRQGDILSINYTVPDLTVEQVIGTPMTDFLPPTYKQIANDCLEGVWSTGKAGQFIVEYENADGGKQYFESNVGPVKDSGNIVALIVSARNVTERILAEQRLRESESTARALLNSPSVLTLLLNTEGEILDANEVMAARFNKTPEQMVGLCLWDLLPPEILKIRKPHILSTALTGNVERWEDYRAGAWFESCTNPIFDEHGKVGKVAVISYDITDRKQVEKVSQRSEVLGLLATDASLEQILSALVTSAEKRTPNMLCSVLLIDEEGKHLLHGAAPSLPGYYNEEIDGIEIGPAVGSCGVAAYTGERVIVEDVMTHPSWENYRELAKKAGLRACWSEPIISTSGKVLGTFATYYREAGTPNQSDLEFITDSARLAGIAIERKQTEEKILASEAELRGILNSLLEVYFRADIDGRIIRISPSALQVFGYRPEEMIGRPSAMVWRYPDKRQEMLEAMRAGGGVVHLFEAEAVRKDGSFLWTSINSHFYHDEQGNIAGVEGTIRDVSIRKQSEQELIRQKALFEAVFRDVPDAMVIANVNREIIMCNPALMRIFGYETEEVVGQQTVILYESQEEFERQGRERFNLSAAEKSKPYTLNYKRKNGDLFPGETVGTPIKDESGATIGFMGVVRDVTDRKQAEVELQRSRQHFQYLDRLSRIISQAPDLNALLGSVLQEMLEIFAVDRAWLFYPGDPDAPSWKVPMEVTREGYPGTFDANVDIPNNPDTAAVLRDALETDGPVIHDFFRREPVPALAKSFNIKTQMIIALHPKIDKPWILGLHQCSHNREWTESDRRLFPDIAERMTSALTNRLLLQQLEADIAQRKRAEEQAKLHQAELAHMARLNIMGEMATGIAHELNQPLTAIANYAAVGSEMVDAGNKNPAKLVKALDSVQVQAERASEIIRRLRQFVKKQSPQRVNVNINMLVKDVVSFMEAETRKQSIQIELKLAGELPLVFADAIQIEQVLLNIVRNSLDAMQNAGIEKPELVIRTSINGDGNVHVYVSDTGPGIDKKALTHIFEPFVTTKGAQGMGMGLSISRSIIEAHGGRLWAESDVGRGTTFYFTLPVNVGETL